MGTDWETEDDDMEKLLEFDDLDPIFSFNAGRKRLLSSHVPHSARTIEAESHSRNSKAGNPCNSPKQLQSQVQMHGLEDDGIFPANIGPGQSGHSAQVGSRDEETIVSISSGTAGRGCNFSQSFTKRDQNLNKDGSGDHLTNFQNMDEDCLGVDELMPSIQKLNGNPPDATNNEESEDQFLEQGGRFLARDNRPEVGGSFQSSQETRAGASKRPRQDRDAAIERQRNNSILLDEFAQRIAGSNKGRFPVAEGSLQPFQPLSSRDPPVSHQEAENVDRRVPSVVELPHQERNRSPDRETSLPSTGLAYKIPGPAGVMQDIGKTSQKAHFFRQNENPFGSRRPCDRPTEAADTLDFREGPWLAAMMFLNNNDSGNHPSRSTILSVTATNRHIPQLVAVITTAVPNGFGDLSVTLKDPTGTIGGSIHHRVLTEFENGQLIAPGAVVILKKVAVFSPTPRVHYLNITIKNVDRIFGKDTIAPRSRAKAVADNFRNNDASLNGRDHSISQVGLNDISQIHRGTKDGCESEPIAPKFRHSERRRMTESTLILRENDPMNKSSRSGKLASNSLPLPTLLEDAVDFTNCAINSNAGLLDSIQPRNLRSEIPDEAKNKRDAIAKAAGWDVIEDVDLLLDDDFTFIH